MSRIPLKAIKNATVEVRAHRDEDTKKCCRFVFGRPGDLLSGALFIDKQVEVCPQFVLVRLPVPEQTKERKDDPAG